MLVHASLDFSIKYPELTKNWHNSSNYIACLSAKDENHLKQLISNLQETDLKYIVFSEPDIDDQITSIAIEPSVLTAKLCSSLPKALKQYNHILLDKFTFKKEVSNG